MGAKQVPMISAMLQQEAARLSAGATELADIMGTQAQGKRLKSVDHERIDFMSSRDSSQLQSRNSSQIQSPGGGGVGAGLSPNPFPQLQDPNAGATSTPNTFPANPNQFSKQQTTPIQPLSPGAGVKRTSDVFGSIEDEEEDHLAAMRSAAAKMAKRRSKSVDALGNK